MYLLRYTGTFLLLFVGSNVSCEEPTQSSNPECSGIEQVMSTFQQSIRKIPIGNHLDCNHNQQCTGFSCNGSLTTHQFHFEITLIPCTNEGPKLQFKEWGVPGNPQMGVFRDGEKLSVFNYPLLRVYMIPTLKKINDTHIAVGSSFQYCPVLGGKESTYLCKTVMTTQKTIVTVKPCSQTGLPTPPILSAVHTHHYSTRNPEPTTNQECSSMDQLAQDLQNNLNAVNAKCIKNAQCTGFICNGTAENHKFSFIITIDHCSGNPELHFSGHGVTASGQHGDLTETFHDGDRRKVIDYGFLTVYLITNIKKQDNTHIKISAKLDVCTLLVCAPSKTVVDNLLITVEPCHNTDLPNVPTSKTGSFPTHVYTLLPTTRETIPTHKHALTSTTGKAPTRGTMMPHTTNPGHTHTFPPKTTLPGSTPGATDGQNGTEKPSFGAAKHSGRQKTGHEHHMSSGAIAGIIITCLVITAALLVGVWYWKRGRHVSRLRSAYYNDISMNDPLYDDFDPIDA